MQNVAARRVAQPERRPPPASLSVVAEVISQHLPLRDRRRGPSAEQGYATAPPWQAPRRVPAVSHPPRASPFVAEINALQTPACFVSFSQRDEDLYAGYDATTPSPDPGATAFAGKRGPPLGTAAGAPRVQPGGGFIPPPSAMARHADVTGSGGLGGGRPMTSNRGAGYTSRPPATGALAAPGGRAAFDPMALGEGWRG